MANFADKSTPEAQQETRYRWENLLALPPNAELWDISTGQTYRRGMFKEIHKDGFENVVDYFEVIGTGERIYVPFLRIGTDKNKCSLGGRTR